jgi:hypothetical protein
MMTWADILSCKHFDLENEGWVKTLISSDFNESLKTLKVKRCSEFIGK